MNTEKRVHSSWCSGGMYMPLMQLLNPKIRYMIDDRISLALDILRDINGLGIHQIKLSQEKQAEQCPSYTIPGSYACNNVFVRNHTGDMWDPKYDVAYHMVWWDWMTAGIGQVNWWNL